MAVDLGKPCDRGLPLTRLPHKLPRKGLPLATSPVGCPRADGSVRYARKLAVGGAVFLLSCSEETEIWLLLKPTLIRSIVDFSSTFSVGATCGRPLILDPTLLKISPSFPHYLRSPAYTNFAKTYRHSQLPTFAYSRQLPTLLNPHIPLPHKTYAIPHKKSERRNSLHVPIIFLL